MESKTMIHLDTNILVDITTSKPQGIAEGLLRNGAQFACSAITWTEFCYGPLKDEQKKYIYHFIGGRVIPYTQEESKIATELFNQTGRRRGSQTDCMIAATAIHLQAPIATKNLKDFQRFANHGLHIQEF